MLLSRIHSLAVACALVAVGLLRAEGVREVKEGGQTYLDLDNGLVALRIAPERGARIVRFTPKFSGKNWVHPEPTFGMALDHFAGQGHPGELDKVTYQYKLLQERAATVVELRARTAQGTRAVPAGIDLCKRIVLTPASAGVTLTYTLTNTTSNAFRVAFMPKFDLYVSGDRAENYYYRPSAKGLDIAWPGGDGQPDHGDVFVKNPICGWTAALNRKTREGLAFIMNYNDLQWLYNCLPCNTVEWLCDPVSLQPAASWRTEVNLVPFQGLTNITFASRNFVADTEIAATDGRITVRHHLCAPQGELRDVRIQTRLKQIATLKEYVFPDIALKLIGADLTTATTEQTIPEDSGLTAAITVSGNRGEQAFTEEYDCYHRGVKGGGFDLLTSAERGYTRTPPRKMKQFSAPAGLTFHPADPPELFEMRGLYGHLYRTQEAAEKSGMKIGAIAYARCSWDGHSLDSFPFDFKEAFKFSAIIVNNIDSTALDDEMQHILKHYVKAGGGLLFLGGYYSFGVGGWDALANMKELFPVRIQGPFDLKPTPATGLIHGAGPLFRKEDFPPSAQVRWFHAVEPGPGAEVAAKMDQMPFIVTGHYGKGRVAALCGTVLGMPDQGRQLFFQTPEWPAAFGKLLRWLARSDAP
ncbi:MAG: hypothetical protein HY360_09635 [Verrucomicrobia bacterium]|nr:hypothetical protein [Verrucomicrobiota bacterium]